MEERFAIFGDILYADEDMEIREFKDSYLIVNGTKVSGIQRSRPNGMVVHDYEGMLVIPGLTDLHLHAPQYQFAGLFMDEELLQWLERHTFPEEGRYADLDYAKKAYSIFTSDLLKSETTRFSIFATIHKDASLMLSQMLEEKGFSGYVGKVNMDMNSPDYLCEDTRDSIESTLSYIEGMKRFENIRPIITPRFIPSCSRSLLKELAGISKEKGLPVQSHLDENLSEIEWVKELVPESRNYSDAYRMMGLWGEEKTIMAHVVWPDDEEMKMLENKNIFVAHSPSSNSNLSSGIAPIRKMLERRINVALATDVAGGSSLSILRMATHAIEVSKLYHRLVDEKSRPLTFREAFYMASLGGGRFFGSVGSFNPGYDADVVVLDSSSVHTTLYDEISLAERLELYAYRCAGSPVAAKFIKGRKVL